MQGRRDIPKIAETAQAITQVRRCRHLNTGGLGFALSQHIRMTSRFVLTSLHYSVL